MFPRAPELAIIHTELSGSFSLKFLLDRLNQTLIGLGQVSITLV